MTDDGTDDDGVRETGDGADGGIGYVHRPDGEPPAADGRFDWRGWTLVATVVVAFFVVPGAILVLPAAQDLIGSLGLTLRDAYLTLPLVPAFLLGAVAVWSAVRARAK